MTIEKQSKAKKHLGQNWLQSEKALAAIVDAAMIQAGDHVLEIGSGQGVLTDALLRAGAKVTAVEKDRDLIDGLTHRFGAPLELNNLTIHQTDFLKFDLGTLPQPYKVVANIPYYITGEIIRRLLSTEHQPELIVLLVQKEVGERIAKNKKESVLSISVKAYGTPQYIKTVPRGAFRPTPRVDSAILAIKNISRKNFQDVDEQKFFQLLKKGFGSKRKQLKNNLVITATAMLSCDLNEKVRPEELTLNQWLCLTKELL